jgi:hypothetical protein
VESAYFVVARTGKRLRLLLLTTAARETQTLAAESLSRASYSLRAGGRSPVSGTKIGVSSLSVSPRKKARSRTAQAIINGAPRASMPTPMTKTPMVNPDYGFTTFGPIGVQCVGANHCEHNAERD